MDYLTADGPVFLFRYFSQLSDIFHIKTYRCSFYHWFLPRIFLVIYTDDYYAMLIKVHIIYITLCITINTIMRYDNFLIVSVRWKHDNSEIGRRKF